MQRGRKSLAARSISNVLALSSPTCLLDRPKAPPELTKEQKAEWDRIVGRMPSYSVWPRDVADAGQPVPSYCLCA